MATTSAIGPVIDWLVAQLPARVTAIEPTTMVVDGYTDDAVTETVVFVGREDAVNAESATAARAILVLGTRRVDEDPQVPCRIEVQRTNGDMKATRDIALALFEAAASLVKFDPTAGGVINGGALQIRDVRISQPVTGIAMQRIVLISFVVAWHHAYNPA